MNHFHEHSRIVSAALLACALLLSAVPCRGDREARRGRKYGQLLESVFTLCDTVAAKRWHYTATYYYRGALSLERKNAIILSTPNRRFYMKDGRDLLTEDEGDMEYSVPGVFTRKARYRRNAVGDYDVSHGYIMEFFNIKPYGAYLLGDHILSPLYRRNAYCYRYSLDSVNGRRAHFSFKRRKRNMQLVDGSFVYDTGNRCVTSITFRGTYNFVTFEEEVTMGTGGRERYWPARARLSMRYWYYGNVFEGTALYTQRYKSLTDEYTPPVDRKDRHDVTQRYALALDTTRLLYDSAYIARHRPEPLTDAEQAIYDNAHPAKGGTGSADTVRTRRRATPKWVKTLGGLGEFFFNDYDLMRTDYSSLRVLSPTWGYSGSRGVSYRQDVEYALNMKGGRRWSVMPRASYFFKEGKLAGRLRSELLFQPRHRGMVVFEAGMQHITANTNNLYFIEDSGSGEGKVESLDFQDFYTHIDVGREIVNGLDLSVGILMHHRRPYGIARTNKKELGLRDRYRDFAPRMTATYTPGQAFYRAGNRKVPVGSRWPTFVADYERGVSGVLGSTNNYEKWEFTVSQGFHFTPLHRLIWKVGGGMFTDRKDGDFVQYEYFNNGITAYNWDDDRSGVFQLLDQEYYNNSYHYLRGHVVVESPMLILGNFSTRVLRAERLYVNALVTEGLVPYLEFGYGVSNELLDISFFSSYIKGESLKTGLKFSLHIFD